MAASSERSRLGTRPTAILRSRSDREKLARGDWCRRGLRDKPVSASPLLPSRGHSAVWPGLTSLIFFIIGLLQVKRGDSSMPYRAGAAARDITPTRELIASGKIWLWGYGNRSAPCEGVHSPISVRALAVTD